MPWVYLFAEYSSHPELVISIQLARLCLLSSMGKALAKGKPEVPWLQQHGTLSPLPIPQGA